jgi:hypothetical protein
MKRILASKFFTSFLSRLIDALFEFHNAGV